MRDDVEKFAEKFAEKSRRTFPRDGEFDSFREKVPFIRSPLVSKTDKNRLIELIRLKKLLRKGDAEQALLDEVDKKISDLGRKIMDKVMR